MKIVYIGILRKGQPESVELCCERELSSYSRFTRDFTFHVYASNQSRGLTGVIISDEEYPSLAAHQVLSKMLDEFITQNPAAASANPPVSFPALRTYITQYQDPQNVGSILKIQKELDETKVVLHKTIESVLERGEKLDDLVQKSEGLSSQSKMFYTSAKKQNSCCVIM
ncbi:hypothetical protein ARAM_003189 [Aspergillus rambellii]|uniref:Synaptobrevin homolog YKT6 n=1 Tax=Aspergillus rambellii TaxID=308745 RepID=A0A0F8VPX7_9EURO|nr:hypothetical protein ARAM_003189 [Aspergillus rambellii]